MSTKKLFPNGEAALEGSVVCQGKRWTLGIVLALLGIAAVVSFVTLLFMVRGMASLREQQMAFKTDLQEELQAYLKDQVLLMQLKHEKQATDKIRLELLKEAKKQAAEPLNPEGLTGDVRSTEDLQRDDSATFWKSAEVHRRSKRDTLESEGCSTEGVFGVDERFVFNKALVSLAGGYVRDITRTKDILSPCDESFLPGQTSICSETCIESTGPSRRSPRREGLQIHPYEAAERNLGQTGADHTWRARIPGRSGREVSASGRLSDVYAYFDLSTAVGHSEPKEGLLRVMVDVELNDLTHFHICVYTRAGELPAKAPDNVELKDVTHFHICVYTRAREEQHHLHDVRLVHLGGMEETVCREYRAQLECKVRPEYKDLPEYRGGMEETVYRAQPDLLDPPATIATPATPEATTPEVITPEATTPEVTTPPDTTPEATTPPDTTPPDTTPPDTTPPDTTPEATTTCTGPDWTTGAMSPIPLEADCAAYRAAGHNTSGVYRLGSPLSGVTVYCDMDTAGGGWTVIQRRMDGSVPFNRTWNEYKCGFGNLSGEYWLGNDNIHLLTAQKNYSLRIDMMDWNGTTAYASYSTFRVSGESDQYRLTVYGYSGTAGHDMYFNNLMKFSTVDRDNDGDAFASCTQWYAQGGWWYRDCSIAFLNGRYLGNCGNTCPWAQGVMWDSWRGLRYSLKSVSMKIKP
ncbi:Fibrinogen- domains (FReDs) [Branchiostoma belcheri]|nr:Fibrinogen- domains (FReDs) [Branchiostoma belcheri]